MAPVSVKKECCHQASQTEETRGQKDYKSLFEKAKQKVSELIKEKEALIAASDTKANLSADKNVENDDEIALQVDALVRELDQRTKETKELLNLQFRHIQRRKEGQLFLAHIQPQMHTEGWTAGRSLLVVLMYPSLIKQFMKEASLFFSFLFPLSLVELRQNVGRLLLPHVPALDLAQVNFECNVIDEILDQSITVTMTSLFK
uniref:Uncharacterized protein n=1 Tax=Neolamprologus brichardi TaxID=32507 RepID=A0A3Q4GLU1_NEOBR